MIRFLLLLVLFYLIWKIVKVFLKRSRYRVEPGKPQQSPLEKPFDHIEDAEFEDVSDKPDDT